MFIENITEFDGIYNGNGYSISNASVISGKNYGGLFGYLKGVYENGVLVSGIIENLNLINIMVNANGAYYIGNIVGYAEGGRISGCVVQGSLKVSSVLTENYNIDIGGIVGFAQNTIIENVSFAGYINVKTASSVSAGGIAGRYQTPPAIESVMLDRLYSFAEISVTTDKWALLGGIIGGVDLLDGGADVYNDLLGEYAYLKNSLAHITSTSFEGASAAIDENSIASGGEEGLSYDQMRASQNPAVAQMADLMVTYVVKDYNLSVGSYYKGQGTPPHKSEYGSADNPVLISNYLQLNILRLYPWLHYKQTNDIKHPRLYSRCLIM